MQDTSVSKASILNRPQLNAVNQRWSNVIRVPFARVQTIDTATMNYFDNCIPCIKYFVGNIRQILSVSL